MMPMSNNSKIGAVLVVIGGLLALLSGIYSIVADQPLVARLTGGTILGGLHGSSLDAMGVVGLIGGLVALASALRSSWLGSLLGGLLGLAAPCGLALLAIIGAILMKK